MYLVDNLSSKVKQLSNSNKKSEGLYQAVFWVSVLIILTFIFGCYQHDYSQSFYFTFFLLPVMIGTSWFFNGFLIPRYILQKKYKVFILYFIYSVIISLYLELWALTLSLYLLAKLYYNRLNPRETDIFLLTVILYFFVFLNGLISYINKYMNNQSALNSLEKLVNNYRKGYLYVRANRKNVSIPYDNIQLIESFGDYIKIHQSTGVVIISKEKIGKIEKDLPENFIRIHRSFIINRDKAGIITSEFIQILDKELPIGRKYKNSIFSIFKDQSR